MKKTIEIRTINRNPEYRTVPARSRLLMRVLSKNGSVVQDILDKKNKLESYIEDVLVIHAY